RIYWIFYIEVRGTRTIPRSRKRLQQPSLEVTLGDTTFPQFSSGVSYANGLACSGGRWSVLRGERLVASRGFGRNHDSPGKSHQGGGRPGKGGPVEKSYLERKVFHRGKRPADCRQFGRQPSGLGSATVGAGG